MVDEFTRSQAYVDASARGIAEEVDAVAMRGLNTFRCDFGVDERGSNAFPCDFVGVDVDKIGNRGRKYPSGSTRESIESSLKRPKTRASEEMMVSSVPINDVEGSNSIISTNSLISASASVSKY